MMVRPTLLLTFLAFVSLYAHSQTSSSFNEDPSSVDRLLSFPGKYIEKVQQNLDDLQQQFDNKTEKYLHKLEKREAKIYKKLWRKDSLAARELMGDVEQRYVSLREDASVQAKQLSPLSQVYSSRLDSLGTAFSFIENSPKIPDELKKKIANASQSVGGLQLKLNQTDQIQKYLKERKQLLAAQLERFGMVRELKQFNKEVYYYQQRLKEYKALLNDPAKLGKKILALAARVPAFKQFFANNSQLGRLFNLPGSLNNNPASLAGLQTRASVIQDLQSRFGSGAAVQQVLQQNMQSAQGQLNELKNKVNQYLPQGGSSDDELPDFKPNNQKTKSFWQRLEYGTNFQSQRPNSLFPVTSDIGLSLGYKINDKSVIGLGASYKMGWGQNIRNINITHQGAGLRSFADVKVKGSFWISGGYEMNYHSEFNRIEVLKNLNAWQQSGLIGMSKVVCMNSKFFKKTKLQLLWDYR